MSGYSLKPGDAGYYTPDEKFSTSTPIDELIRGGYMLSDDQVSKLSPEQKAQYASAFFNIALEKQQAATGWGKPTGNNASLWSKPTGNNASFKTPQELMGQILELQGPQSTGLPVDIRGLVSGIGQQIVMAPLQKQRYDPRFPGKEVTTGKDPNWVNTMGLMPKLITGAVLGGMGLGLAGVLGPGTMAGTVGAGFGSGAAGAGVGAAGAGVGAGAGGSSIPGLAGVPGVGTAAGTFPLTTVGASGLEAGLFPLTTVGAVGGATAGAVGGLGSILPDWATLENANRARKVVNVGRALLGGGGSGGGGSGGGDGSGNTQAPYDPNAPLPIAPNLPRFAAGGGIGDIYETPDGMAKGGYLNGPGDGMSDSIPAVINGTQPAALADGEYVLSSDIVSHIGNGSSKAGAKWLDGMVSKLRKARTGTAEQGKQINPSKFLPY